MVDEGFRLAAPFVRELASIDLVAHPAVTAARTLMVSIEKSAAPLAKDLTAMAEAMTAAGGSCSVETTLVPCLPWVHEKRMFANKFPTVIDATRVWLENNV